MKKTDHVTRHPPIAIGSLEYGMVNAVGRMTEWSMYFLSNEDIKSFQKHGRGNWEYPNATSKPEGKLDTVSLLIRRKATVLGTIAKLGRPLPMKCRDRLHEEWYGAGVTREELLVGGTPVPAEAQSLIHALESNVVQPDHLATKNTQHTTPILVVSSVLFMLLAFAIQRSWHLLFV